MLRSICAATLLAAIPGIAFAAVRFTQDAQHQTPRIWGLIDGETECSFVDFAGVVAQRSFAEDGVTLSGFVVEHADGTRMFINVFAPQTQDRFTRGAVLSGLQRLLRVGRRAIGRVQACGAGPVLTLDQVQ